MNLLPPGTDEQVMVRLFPETTRYAADPGAWMRERARVHTWSHQDRFFQSVADHRYTSWRSAHGVGKSFSVAALAHWWIDTHPIGEAFVVWTAPRARQVHTIVGREIRKMHKRLGLPGRITLDSKWYIGDTLVGQGMKPGDTDEDAFQGIHARYVLVIIDEANGVPQAVWDGVDALMTGPDCRAAAVGNPTSPGSEFSKQHKPGSGWNILKTSVFDSPLFTGEAIPPELARVLVGKEWEQERAKRWGVDSPRYVSRALAEFPTVGDEVLIHPAWIEAAQNRDLPGLSPGRFGLDVSRHGDDKTVLYRNRDGVIRLVDEWGKKDTMETADRVAMYMDEHRGHVPCVIDVTGLGWGVYDKLNRDDYEVIPLEVGTAARNRKRFVNKRAEQWWAVRILFENGLVDLDPDDEELAAELGNIKWFEDAARRKKIETKEEMAKRGLKSPNRADAVMASCVATELNTEPDDEEDESLAPPPSLTADLLNREL